MTNCMKSKSKSISVLIPDGESSFLQIVVNCLSLVKNIKIFVISSNKSDFMKYSFFVEEYIFFTDSSDEEWLNRINHEVEKNNIDIETATGGKYNIKPNTGRKLKKSN